MCGLACRPQIGFLTHTPARELHGQAPAILGAPASEHSPALHGFYSMLVSVLSGYGRTKYYEVQSKWNPARPST